MRRDATDFRRGMSGWFLMLTNLVRRVVPVKTSGGQWGIEGYETNDDVEGVGEDAADDDLVDVFQGLYVYARPAAADQAEALMLHVGGEAEHPTIGALRNEDARRRYVTEFGDIAQGEIAIFNSQGTTRVHITAAGDIQFEVPASQEIRMRTPGGSTSRIVTEEDFLAHGHASAPLGPVVGPILAPAPTPATPFKFTRVLKAERTP